jgi:molecular chaperone GrpE
VNDALADFRRWCEEALAGGTLPEPAPPGPDLATLLGHFVALRQEINLQTRSVRAQQEQTAEFALAVRQSLDDLARPRPAPEGDDPARPLVKALIDAYDALALAGQQVRRSRDALLPALAEAVPEAGDEAVTAPEAGVTSGGRPFWKRWFLSPTAEEAVRAGQEQARQAIERLREERRQARQAGGRVAAALEGLIAGYTMSLERIDRALRQHGLEPIPTAGATFDPELMEALEPVAGTGRPSGEVVEEVRRGYRQGGRLVRYALVRVARD